MFKELVEKFWGAPFEDSIILARFVDGCGQSPFSIDDIRERFHTSTILTSSGERFSGKYRLKDGRCCQITSQIADEDSRTQTCILVAPDMISLVRHVSRIDELEMAVLSSRPTEE